ncbi:hypothetical protein QJQ45_026191, partial [Haematococcus lacustris]
HTTEEQDEQTMPPSMPKQQQGWATARSIAAAVLQQIQQVPALLRLLRSQPDSKVVLQLSTLQDAEHIERMGQEVMEVFGRCGSADQQAQLLDRVLTSPQLELAVQQAMPTTKQRVACLLLDRVQLLMDSGTCGKKGGQHTDDLCTLGKKLSVKISNEYCKAVGLHVSAGTLRAELRYMVLEHLNEQAECD